MAKLVSHTDYCETFSAFPVLFIVRAYSYWLNRFLLFQRSIMILVFPFAYFKTQFVLVFLQFANPFILLFQQFPQIIY